MHGHTNVKKKRQNVVNLRLRILPMTFAFHRPCDCTCLFWKNRAAEGRRFPGLWTLLVDICWTSCTGDQSVARHLPTQYITNKIQAMYM